MGLQVHAIRNIAIPRLNRPVFDACDITVTQPGASQGSGVRLAYQNQATEQSSDSFERSLDLLRRDQKFFTTQWSYRAFHTRRTVVW